MFSCEVMVLNVPRYMANVLCFLFQFSLIQVDIYESRSFIGGKVGSFVDKRGNHIEMGLHVFFGCYNNLFRLMKKVNNFLQSKCMSFFSCILFPYFLAYLYYCLSWYFPFLSCQSIIGLIFLRLVGSRWVRITIYLWRITLTPL